MSITPRIRQPQPPLFVRVALLAPLLLFLFFFGSVASAVEVSSEDFSTGLGTWTAGPAQSPDSSLLWDMPGQRAHLVNPGTVAPGITDIHDLDPGHKITLNDGDRAIFTVDFQFNNAIFFVDFILADDTESWQAGFRYNHATKEVSQFGFASSGPYSVAAPLSTNTMYTAVLELDYSGDQWNPSITINGESFVGTPDTTTPAGMTVHQHLQTFTPFTSTSDVYYDNATFEFIAAPEPGTAFLVLVACVPFALCRRRHG